MKKLFLAAFAILLLGCESAEDKADRFFLKGNVALEEGKNEEAIRFYDEAIAINPKLKHAYNNKGIALYREGKLEEAIATYTDVLFNIDAYFMAAKRNRLDANLEAKHFEAASRDLRFLADAYPDSAFVAFKRGELFMKLKGYRRAIVAFNRSYIMDSTRVDALVNAAIGYYHYGNFFSARESLEKATAKNPEEPNIYNTYAMMAIDEEKYEEAMLQVNKAIDLDPSNPFYYNNRGYIHMMTGNLEQAEPDIKRAIQGDPQNAFAYRNRGILLHKQGDHEGAIRNFELTEKSEPEMKKMYAAYGDALFALDRKVEACSKWQVSLDMFENDARESIEAHCK